MKEYDLKSRFQITLKVSLTLGVLGVFLFLLQSREPNFLIYFFFFLIASMTIFSEWMLIYLLEYLFKVRNEFRKKNVLFYVLYFVFGIAFTYFIIDFGHSVITHFTQNIELQPYYQTKRIAYGIVSSIIVLYTNYTLNLFFDRRRISIENEKLLRENLQARFDTLSQQVNPHFLFNSLNTLKSLMRTDVDKAEEFLLRLSDVFRYSLQTTNVAKVTLIEELEILDAYIYMLKGRFGDNLNVDFDILSEQKKMYVPPFVLQIIVENCEKHNIISKYKPLFIKIKSVDEGYLSVSNNLQPKSSVENSSKVGLANIDKRYQYLSGQHIEIKEDEKTFEVIIPLIKEL